MPATIKPNHCALTRMALERFSVLTLAKAGRTEILAHNRFPFPGHMELFERGLAEAQKAAASAGGLFGFWVFCYHRGEMMIDARLKRNSYKRASGLALGKVQRIVDDIAHQSTLHCCICGRDKVRPASRFLLDGHKMPLCTRQIHDDSAIDELLRPRSSLMRCFQTFCVGFGDGAGRSLPERPHEL